MSGANTFVKFYGYDELENAYEQSTDILKNTAQAAREALCSLYNQYPDWVSFGAVPGSWAEASVRGFWKGLCPSSLPHPPRPLPPFPFEGGQCPTLYYGSFYRNIRPAGNPSAPIISEVGGFQNVSGPITAFRVVEYSDRWSYQLAAVDSPYDKPEPGWHQVGTLGKSSGYVEAGSVMNELFRSDGLPDDCGNPTPSPVPDPPTPPPAIALNFNLTVPIDVGFNVDVKVPVQIKPTLNLYVLGPNILVFSPDFNLDFSPSFNPSFSPSFNPSLNINPSLNFYFGIGGVGVDFDDLQPVDCPEPEKKKRKYLLVTLTQLPDKAQFSNTGATVYFAGWIAFVRENFRYAREQVNFETSVFEFPVDADDYEVTFTNGAAGSTSVLEIEE